MAGKKTHRNLIEGWHPFTDEECRRYRARGLWHGLTVLDLLDRHAAVHPDKLAVVDEKTEVTWAELKRRSDRLALHLHRLGVGYGDFFVLDLMNTVEYTYFYFGLNRLGAIPVMCLPRHRQTEVEHQIRLHEAKGIAVPIGERFDYVEMVNGISSGHPQLKILLTVGGEPPQGWTPTEGLLGDKIEEEYPQDFLEPLKPDSNDICIEQLSGGTTGLPKGIPKTHNEYICQWDYLGRAAGYTDESVALIVIPALHNAAFALCFGPAVFRGGTTVLCKSPGVEKQLEMIARYGVTHTFLIPIHITYWMQAREKMGIYDLSSLKVIWSGAEKVRPEFVQWILEDLGVHFVNVLGTTEGIHFCTRWHMPKEPQMNTVGKPAIIDPNVEVRLVDDRGRDVQTGEIGEMISRGALTFKGYFRNEEENRRSFDDLGFFHSGDLMSRRDDGCYVVEGRKKDMIKRAGENVYPSAVEDKIATFHKVAHCAVVGMPDEVLGEKLCAFIQPVAGERISLENLVGYLKGLGIAVFNLPERLEIVDGWPLTPKNAIDKRRLRAYITAKAVEEGAITKAFGNEYLKRDGLSVDDVLMGKVKIDFNRTPT